MTTEEIVSTICLNAAYIYKKVKVDRCEVAHEDESLLTEAHALLERIAGQMESG